MVSEPEPTWLRRFTKKQGWANGELHHYAFMCRSATATREAETSVSYSVHAPPLHDDVGKDKYLAHFEARANQRLGLCVVAKAAFEAAGLAGPENDPDESDPYYGHLHASTPCISEEQAEGLLSEAVLWRGF